MYLHLTPHTLMHQCVEINAAAHYNLHSIVYGRPLFQFIHRLPQRVVEREHWTRHGVFMRGRIGCCDWPSKNRDSDGSRPVSKLYWPARAFVACGVHCVQGATEKFSPRQRKCAVQLHGYVMCGSIHSTSWAHTQQSTICFYWPSPQTIYITNAQRSSSLLVLKYGSASPNTLLSISSSAFSVCTSGWGASGSTVGGASAGMSGVDSVTVSDGVGASSGIVPTWLTWPT